MLSPFARVSAIELGKSRVRIAVVQSGLRDIRLVDWADEPIELAPDDAWEEAAVRAARDARRRLNADPGPFVLALPMSWSVLRSLTVPFRGARKVAAAVPFELEPNLAIPIEDLVIDHMVADASGKTTTVLAAGVRRASIESHVDILNKAGIPLEGANLDGIGMLSVWALSHARAKEPVALLSFEAEGAVLGVVSEGNLATLRRLDVSAPMLRTDPEAVARNVQNALRAHATAFPDAEPVARLDVAGADPMEAGRTLFASSLDMPVDFIDPMDRVGGMPAPANSGLGGDSWAPLVGVAVSAAGGPFHLDLFDRAYTGATANRTLARLAIRGSMAGAAVLAAFLTAAVVDYQRKEARLEALGEAVWREFAATYPDVALERPSNDRGGAKSFELMQLAAEEESNAAFGISLDSFRSPPFVEILLTIGRNLPERTAAIRDISLRRTNDGHELTLSGEIRNAAQYETALDTLEKNPDIDVDRDRSRRTSQGGTETFQLRLRI